MSATYDANRDLFEELDRVTEAASDAMDADDMDAWSARAGRGAELYKELAERLGWDTSAPRYGEEGTVPETTHRTTCPPAERPDLVPHRARVTCARCGRDWIATGRVPAWRPVRWWHYLARRKPGPYRPNPGDTDG